MQTLRRLLLLTVLLSSASLFAKDDPFSGVQAFFSAISAVDHERIRHSVTSDFHLLEDGEVWDVNDLIEVAGPSQAGRRNYFHVIRTARSGNSAWISYWNKAVFRGGEQIFSRAWLESAVLVRDGDMWRL
ncbi:MAG: hypothetical protein V2I48_08850 [Xanthomonadales bacterium]|jgi:hypothetical protein|nr:hypothetical protein [Xanthomonadales bacterium]